MAQLAHGDITLTVTGGYNQQQVPVCVRRCWGLVLLSVEVTMYYGRVIASEGERHAD